jgi:hypothetical protein
VIACSDWPDTVENIAGFFFLVILFCGWPMWRYRAHIDGEDS